MFLLNLITFTKNNIKTVNKIQLCLLDVFVKFLIFEKLNSGNESD